MSPSCRPASWRLRGRGAPMCGNAGSCGDVAVPRRFKNDSRNCVGTRMPSDVSRPKSTSMRWVAPSSGSCKSTRAVSSAPVAGSMAASISARANRWGPDATSVPAPGSRSEMVSARCPSTRRRPVPVTRNAPADRRLSRSSGNVGTLMLRGRPRLNRAFSVAIASALARSVGFASCSASDPVDRRTGCPSTERTWRWPIHSRSPGKRRKPTSDTSRRRVESMPTW